MYKAFFLKVHVYGSEIWTLRKNEEWAVNAFETLCWRRTLKIKWRDRITNDEVFQRAKQERLLVKIKKKKKKKKKQTPLMDRAYN